MNKVKRERQASVTFQSAEDEKPRMGKKEKKL